MEEYNYLIDNQIIDKNKLLLLYYNRLNINEEELVMIMIIEQLLSTNQLVTTTIIEKMMSLNKDKIEKNLHHLVALKYISFNQYEAHNSIDTSLIYQVINKIMIGDKINDVKEKEVISDTNLIKLFEKEFKIKFSPMQIEIIREWSSIYTKEIIVYALKEAVSADIINLRYIEKIIKDQSRLLNG